MLFTGVRVGELATLKTFDFMPGNKRHIQRTISKEKDEDGKSHRIISDFPKTSTSEFLSSEHGIFLEKEHKIIKLTFLDFWKYFKMYMLSQYDIQSTV